jgi:biopolymer transport protein ExbD
MASVDTAQPRAAGRGQKKHKKKRRLGIRIDMTPMVDVAFLLLTFFMLTTSMSKPQTMEINLPPGESKVEVAESNLLTLRVMDDGGLFWNIGVEPPKKVDKKDLHNLLVERSQSNPKLITLVKVDRKSKYNQMVDVMDELQVANITRFSLAPMFDQDKVEVEKAKASL